MYVHAEAADFLNTHLKEEALPALSEGLAYYLAQNEGAEKQAEYQRLAKIVQDHPMSLEVRSLAYIFYEKNKGTIFILTLICLSGRNADSKFVVTFLSFGIMPLSACKKRLSRGSVSPL